MAKQILVTIVGAALFAAGAFSTTAQVNKSETPAISLTQAQASHFAKLALKCVAKEYPNKPEHVMNDGGDVQSPKVAAPCLLRLLRLAFLSSWPLDARATPQNVSQPAGRPGHSQSDWR